MSSSRRIANGAGRSRRSSRYSTANRTLEGRDGPERVTAVTTEKGLFDLLGVRPLAGRVFTHADAPDVVVLSEGFWRRRFGAGTGLDDRTIVIDGRRHTVIGIMPASFQFPYRVTPTDLWVPTELPRTDNRFQRIDVAVGRLSPGVTLEGAATEFRAIGEGLGPLSQSNPPRSVAMTPLTESVVGRSRRGVLIVFAAAAVVLLIACANVASLLLARAEARRREVAVRKALGASTGLLIRQFLAESLLLALAASAAALFIANAGTRALVWITAAEIPRALEIGIDWTTFGFLLAVGVCTGIVFGLVPILHAVQSDVSGTLYGLGDRGTAGRSSVTVNRILVISEISLAFILLAGAGLLFRAFLGLEGAPTGLVLDRALTMRLEMSATQMRQPAEPEVDSSAQGRYLQAIEDRVRQIPGVRAAGFVTRLHVQSPGNTGTFTIPGRPAPPDARGFFVRLREASPGYFRALGIPLRAGSLFTSRSDAIVVNEALVREYFPGEDPIGRALDRGTIVGVVGDVRQRLRLAAEPEIYRPLSRTSYSAATLVVSGDIDATVLTAPVRAAIRDVNPGQPVFDVRTMDQVIMASHGDVNLSLALIGLFAGLALILASAGVYGVISYTVARRRREFGIRLALGASPRRLKQLVLAQGGGLVLAGVAFGAAGAAVITRFLRALLYEVTPTDPLTFLATALLLAGVACVACLTPARRAMRVDPISVLRGD